MNFASGSIVPDFKILRKLRFALGICLLLSFSVALSEVSGEWLLTKQIGCALGLLLSIVLGAGIWPPFSAGFLLVLHFFFHPRAAIFSWDPALDLLLFSQVLSVAPLLSSVYYLPAVRFCCGLAIVWNSWSQISAAPWISVASLDRYLHHAPMALLISDPHGLIPLIQILGGLAWLLQLSFLLIFWQKTLRLYWAVQLFFLFAALTFLMPPSFNEAMGLSCMIPFLPGDWRLRGPKLQKLGRALGLCYVTLILTFTIFHRNITEQFSIFKKIDNPFAQKTYSILTEPFVTAGNLILFNSIWKMYSPTWRHVVWIEWYARQSDGSMVNILQENFSPNYRMYRRTWTQALWSDFKKEKVFVGMLSGANEKTVYSQYLCQILQQQTGHKPLSIHAEINSFDIRDFETEWDIHTQKPDRIETQPEVPCA